MQASSVCAGDCSPHIWSISRRRSPGFSCGSAFHRRFHRSHDPRFRLAGTIEADMVLDGERLTEAFPLDHFDTVLCFECLEHTVQSWLVVEQTRRMLIF